MSAAERAVAIAMAEYDRGVAEVPPGSNTGPRIREYQAATWLGGTGWPWCVAFALWCWQRALGRPLPYRGAGAYAWLDWARGAGWALPSHNPRLWQPGDLVVFALGAGHMGLLRRPVSDGIVSTVDGNVADAVRLRDRSLTLVRGVIRVRVEPTRPVKPPMWEVVTSESGHKVIYVSGARAIGRRLPQFLRKYPVLTIRRRRYEG